MQRQVYCAPDNEAMDDEPQAQNNSVGWQCDWHILGHLEVPFDSSPLGRDESIIASRKPIPMSINLHPFSYFGLKNYWILFLVQ